MATRVHTTPLTQLHPSALINEWTGISGSDDADWALLGHYNDKCVHVFGVFSGGTITLQGSNEDGPSPSNGAPLTDPTQTLISITTTGIRQVLENPLYIRPVLTGGDVNTSLTVRLVCRT